MRRVVNCPDNLGQQMPVADAFLNHISPLWLLSPLSRAMRPRMSLARWPKCWRKAWEKYVTDVKPHWAATSATVSALSAAVALDQHRVGEVQAAGQDVLRDGDAVGGEDPGQLPLTDPDRRRDLFGAQAGIGQVLLYIGAPGGAVRCRWSRGTSGCQQPQPGRARYAHRPAGVDRSAWPGQ